MNSSRISPVSLTLFGVGLLFLSACQTELTGMKKASVDSLGAPLSTAASAPAPAASPPVDPRVTDLNRIKEGSEAPDFTLEDMDRKQYRLADFRGQKNVILVFYRGYF